MDVNQTDYTVLARRFRPQGFAEVVGQEHVAQSLKNAILGNRVAHAYLFTGARGVGKTSMARILAKSLNCPHAVDANPCNACDVCRSIAVGSDMDVQEIDGASNRGIDDIRQLRANVNVRSMRSRFKVYIVDEVHMLTKEAFNALLKTLEEPPPNVKFVFCTTEPNKLPDTILSRCQRFDFGTIETTAIMERLRQIAAAEGRLVAPAALQLVARRAAGSMRDSQSLFDQVLAYGSEEVTPADVHRLLGTAPDERLIDLFDAVIARDRIRTLQTFHLAMQEGVQLAEFSDQILTYLRDLMVLAAGGGAISLLSVADEARPRLLEQGTRWGLRTVVAGLQIFAEARGKMQRTPQGQVLVELALVRLTLLQELETLDAILQRLSQGGSAQIGGGSTPVVSGAAPRSGLSLPSPTVTRPTPPQKKNEPATVRESGPQTAMTPLVGEPGASSSLPQEAERISAATTGISLTEANVGEFWQGVVSQFPGLLRDSARKAMSVAISGPNQLVVTFPKGYDIHRNACEQGQGRLEQNLTEAAGKTIKLVFRTADAAEGGPAPTEGTVPPVPEKRRETVGRGRETPNDPLVQKAIELFGGVLRSDG